MARLVSCQHQHAGNQARQDLERSAARGLVKLFPEARCEALPERTLRWIGRVEKSQIQLHDGSPSVAVPTPIDRPPRAAARWRNRSKKPGPAHAPEPTVDAAHAATMTFVPVSPLDRDQRATAVREAGQHEQNTAAADTADDGERAALKRVALAGDRHRIGKIPAMGSLSPLPLTMSGMTGC